ncbi:MULTISPECIES: hypothetical protein [Rhizobium]|uniref:Secreted protein n=1 Tax=Rhizobium favelukesii TaxID=348824 RepID=W6R6I7_9HYPH|nr:MULTISPECIES: hypothetical protein [Rhizobium]MCA0801041.1 hypothetical protein [Rhizobium sp. T1473]MCS0458595.1 hypothetical protein [Rhizobium favelukesii]UFS81404.1 hypothetical protein LPB79_24290 [Rhizobium sp. T136]CDM56897.1 hypothetical protein LPU83_1223 [Rhizobium favelukesii]
MIGRFVILFCLAATSALAEDCRPYANARFGYAVDLTAGFTLANDADNGDGMTLQSADGMAKQDSWQINYSKPSRTFASYSGTRKDRTFYARAVALCHDAIGYLMLEYPKAALKAYDPVVQHLDKTLAAPPRCWGQSPAFAMLKQVSTAE